MPKPLTDISGTKRGKLLILWLAGRNKQHKPIWACQCDCGKVIYVVSCGLSGNSNSKNQRYDCGRFCPLRLGTSKIAGNSKTTTPEYRAYRDAMYRCTKPQNKDWPRYGGRGIQFKLTSLSELISNIGLRPSNNHSLDRINNNGHYETGNLRWATTKEQDQNKRKPVQPKELRNKIFELEAALIEAEHSTYAAYVG